MRASIKSTPTSLIRELNYVPYRERHAHLSPKMSVSSKPSFYTFKPQKKSIPLKESEVSQQIFFDFSDNDSLCDEVSSPIHELDQLVGFEKVEMLEMVENVLNCIVEEPESERKIEENESSTTEHYEDHKYLGVDDWKECNDANDEVNSCEPDCEQKEGELEIEFAAKQNFKCHTSKNHNIFNNTNRKFTSTNFTNHPNQYKKTLNPIEQAHNPEQKQAKPFSPSSATQQAKLNDHEFNETLKKLRENRKEKRESIKIEDKKKLTKDADSRTSNKLLKRFKNKNL